MSARRKGLFLTCSAYAGRQRSAAERAGRARAKLTRIGCVGARVFGRGRTDWGYARSVRSSGTCIGGQGSSTYRAPEWEDTGTTSSLRPRTDLRSKHNPFLGFFPNFRACGARTPEPLLPYERTYVVTITDASSPRPISPPTTTTAG